MIRLKACLLGTIPFATMAAAHAEPLRVDITQGLESPLLIAVPDSPSGQIAGIGDGKDLGQAIAAIMRRDLDGSGLFRIVGEGVAIPAKPVSLFAPFQRVGAQELLIGAPRLTPDGLLSIDCSLYDVFGGRQEISQVITVDRPQWRRLAHKCADLVYQRATGDRGYFDTQIAYVSETGGKIGRTTRIGQIDYDGANQQMLSSGDDLVVFPRYSPDGRHLVLVSFVGTDARLMLIDLATAQTNILPLPKGVPIGPRFSPDGQALILSIAGDLGSDIYRYDIASGRLARLGLGSGKDTSPSYSPDGRKIVFESTRAGTQQLYVMNSDGSDATRISYGTGNYGSPTWSPRGDLIAFTKVEASHMRIGTMRIDGSRERILTDGHQDEAPSWAPGGRLIAFQRAEGGERQPELWTTDITGRIQRRIADGIAGSDPNWSGSRQ